MKEPITGAADAICRVVDRPRELRYLVPCVLCADQLVAELLAVPGLVDDWTTTRASFVSASQ
ncbi:hypothetical protein ACQP1O_17775 [Nocardia sp. CA-151230]|uniref:hypothetical protein n=1 Tax=Nocardia sp. CA-151230 TaxID=3239982 RepID=UPI003D8C07E3